MADPNTIIPTAERTPSGRPMRTQGPERIRVVKQSPPGPLSAAIRTILWFLLPFFSLMSMGWDPDLAARDAVWPLVIYSLTQIVTVTVSAGAKRTRILVEIEPRD